MTENTPEEIKTEEPSDDMKLLQSIESVLEEQMHMETSLETGWFRVGMMLEQVTTSGCWKLAVSDESQQPCKTFDEYIRMLGNKYRRRRSQLFNYRMTARELGPYLTEDQQEMGITKARELARSIKQTGLPPSAEIIEKAALPDTPVADVRRMLYGDAQIGDPIPEGKTWFEMTGFYVDENERLVIETAFEKMWRTDPVVKVGDLSREKEAILRMCMEVASGPEA